MTNYDILKEYEAHQTPVPSYEEWQASYNCMLENEMLRFKNAQLKELLKECREEIASVEWDSVVNDRNQIKLLTKIDEVLK